MTNDINTCKNKRYKKDKQVYYIYLFLENRKTKIKFTSTSIIQDIISIISNNTNKSNLQFNFIVMDFFSLYKKENKVTLKEYKYLENLIENILEPESIKFSLLSEKYYQLRKIQVYLTKMKKDLYTFCQNSYKEDLQEEQTPSIMLKQFNDQLTTVFENIKSNLKESKYNINFDVIQKPTKIKKCLIQLEKTNNILINLTMEDLKILIINNINEHQ